MDKRTQVFLKSMVFWLGMTLALSIGIYYGLSFILLPLGVDPITFQMIDIAVVMIVIIGFTFYLFKNPNKIPKYFMSNDAFDMSKNGTQSTAKAHCMACGKQLAKNERQCSRCGSRQARYY